MNASTVQVVIWHRDRPFTFTLPAPTRVPVRQLVLQLLTLAGEALPESGWWLQAGGLRLDPEAAPPYQETPTGYRCELTVVEEKAGDRTVAGVSQPAVEAEEEDLLCESATDLVLPGVQGEIAEEETTDSLLDESEEDFDEEMPVPPARRRARTIEASAPAVKKGKGGKASVAVDEDEDEASAPAASTRWGQSAAPDPRRRHNATVRYYSQMNPDRVYPLVVILSREQLEAVRRKGVKEGKQELSLRSEADVEVEPVLPGCYCYPPRRTASVRDDQAECRFWVVPHVRGPVRGAVVQFKQDGAHLAEIPLEISVVDSAFVRLAALATLCLPFVTALLRHFELDFESQLTKRFSVYLTLLNYLISVLRPEWLALGLVGLTAVAAWWVRPRERESFWDLARNQSAGRGWWRQTVEAVQGGMRQGLRIGLLSGGVGLLLSGAIVGLAVYQERWEQTSVTAQYLLLAFPAAAAALGWLVGFAVAFFEEWGAE